MTEKADCTSGYMYCPAIFALSKSTHENKTQKLWPELGNKLMTMGPAPAYQPSVATRGNNLLDSLENYPNFMAASMTSRLFSGIPISDITKCACPTAI